MILAIATHRSSNRIIGFRLLDTETTKVLDVAYDKVLRVVSEHEGYVSNIKYNDKKKSIDTNFSKYPKLVNNKLSSKASIIVLEKSIGNSYRVSDFVGNIVYMGVMELAEYSVTEGLANGVVKRNTDGLCIVQLNGEQFPDDELLTKTKSGKNLVSVRRMLGKDDYTIDNTTFFAEANENTPNISSLRLGDGVVGIKAHGFNRLMNLKEVFMSDTVLHIQPYAFADCRNLEKVTFSNNIKVIESFVFKGCRKLKTVSLPVSVERIKHLSFQGCTSLKEIHMSRRCKADYGAIPVGVRIRYY